MEGRMKEGRKEEYKYAQRRQEWREGGEKGRRYRKNILCKEKKGVKRQIQERRKEWKKKEDRNRPEGKEGGKEEGNEREKKQTVNNNKGKK